MPASFDAVARVYRWAEYAALGPLLERVRMHFLPRLADRREARVLGDGDGRFLAALLRANPAVRATAVDASAGMLALLEKRCAFAAKRLRVERADILSAEWPATPPDLVVTHFVLDCFAQEEVDQIARAVARYAAPDAVWLVSDFGRPRSRMLTPFAAAYIRALYLAFRVLTGLRTQRLPDTERALSLAGFTRVERREWMSGFLYTELWARAYNRSSAERMSTAHHPEHNPEDAIPDPEPAAPSLPEPDPGVFHHDPATPGKPTGQNA